MHILSTADTVGGVWTYALDLARALPNHRFSLVTMGRCPTEAQRVEAEAIANLRLYPTEWKLEWMPQPWDEVDRAGEWLLELEQQLQPDIVHLNGYSHAVLPFSCPVLVVAHSCVGSWWRAVKGGDPPPEWDAYRERVRRGLQAASVVVSPTKALLTQMEALYGRLPSSRIIHNGARQIVSGGGGPQPFVLAAGRLWDEAKNIGVLDKFADKLTWPIKVAGEASLAGNDFYPGHLRYLGFLQPACLRQTMNEAAIWAHPALYEPFGLAVLEAAQAGCALVLSDIPTLRELWSDAAVFVGPRDRAAWHAALQGLIDNPEERQRLSEKARIRATRYSLEHCAEAYESLYRSLT